VEAEPDRLVACNNVSFLFDDHHRDRLPSQHMS
jgi:hypothetical protein